jgi:hypothetical protein
LKNAGCGLRGVLGFLLRFTPRLPFLFEFIGAPAELDGSVYPRGFRLGVRESWHLGDPSARTPLADR